MRGQALIQLTQIALQFDESKSNNPFAYYTAAVTNSFTRVLNVEKRQRDIRDDLLQDAGQMPSWTRQMEHIEQHQAEVERLNALKEEAAEAELALAAVPEEEPYKDAMDMIDEDTDNEPVILEEEDQP
jgi:hypothetical protein